METLEPGCDLNLDPAPYPGEEPPERPAPPSSALAWETLAVAREKAASRRGRSAPSHTATESRGDGQSALTDPKRSNGPTC